jgi:hypothetical protein
MVGHRVLQETLLWNELPSFYLRESGSRSEVSLPGTNPVVPRTGFYPRESEAYSR